VKELFKHYEAAQSVSAPMLVSFEASNYETLLRTNNCSFRWLCVNSFRFQWYL
jgi:hypothetical protein